MVCFKHEKEMAIQNAYTTWNDLANRTNNKYLFIYVLE